MSARKTIIQGLLAWVGLCGCRDAESTATAPSPAPIEIALPAKPNADAEPVVPERQAPVEVFAVAPLELDRSAQTEARALRTLGAIPAWDAVVDRGEYLARRHRRGVIYGRLGGVTERYRWLIDDTEGAGALAVRLAYPGAPELASGMREGQRLAVWGAWHVDDARAWYWQAERVAELAPEPEPASGEPPAFAPGHQILEIVAPPLQAKLVSEHIATSQGRAGEIVFVVRSVPSEPGDGWEIADGPADPPAARLHLPGERKSYGAQDYRAPSERFVLARGGQYVVKVQKFFGPRPGQTVLILRAQEPPRRIVGKARKARAPGKPASVTP